MKKLNKPKQTHFEKIGKNEVLLIPGNDEIGHALNDMTEVEVESLIRKFLEDKNKQIKKEGEV